MSEPCPSCDRDLHAPSDGRCYTYAEQRERQLANRHRRPYALAVDAAREGQVIRGQRVEGMHRATTGTCPAGVPLYPEAAHRLQVQRDLQARRLAHYNGQSVCR